MILFIRKDKTLQDKISINNVPEDEQKSVTQLTIFPFVANEYPSILIESWIA